MKKQSLIEQMKKHIIALRKVNREGEPYRRLKGKALLKYLNSLTIKELEHEDSALRTRRFIFNV